MIVIDKFSGLATNASPYAIPVTAAVTQVNLQCLVPGQLSVRPGMAAVSWSSHTGGATNILRIFRAPCDNSERLIYQNAAGQVIAATGPT